MALRIRTFLDIVLCRYLHYRRFGFNALLSGNLYLLADIKRLSAVFRYVARIGQRPECVNLFHHLLSVLLFNLIHRIDA